MPTRTCIVCRSKYEKKLLNRIVVDERGEVLADLIKKLRQEARIYAAIVFRKRSTALKVSKVLRNLLRVRLSGAT